MRYTKFIIENYKGIPKIELDLSKKPSANIFTLVGLNESGKTSILEAIHLFSAGVTRENAHRLIPKNKKHSFNESIKITAEVFLDEESFKYIKSQTASKKFIISGETELIKISDVYTFKNSIPEEGKWKQRLWTTNFKGKTRQSKTEKKLIEWNESVWSDVINSIEERLPKIIYYPDFLFAFPEKIYLEKYNGEGKEQEEYRKVVEDVLQSIDKSLTLEDGLLDKVRQADSSNAHKEALDQLLLKVSSELDSEILKSWDQIFNTEKKRTIDIKYHSEMGHDGIIRYFLEFKIKQGSDSYYINERSLGFRWFFSFLIFTAFRKNRVDDSGETLFLLDEPASNLHQSSQKRLLESLDQIFHGAKLIYSTHSHHLINPKWLAGTYIVKNNATELDENENNVQATLYKNFVSKYPDEQDHFKPILDTLDYSPSRLELVPPLLFTEGKNDYYTFSYLFETILGKKKVINFFPGAGKDKYDLPFRLYLAWGKKFIGVFDSDDGGKKAKEKYIKDIGDEISDKLFTLNDIDPKWAGLETEDLFTDTEKMKIIQYSFPDHAKEIGYKKDRDKSKLNTAIQQLFIDNTNIELNKTTKEKFEHIFDFALKKLGMPTITKP